jgi:dynein intermediate chain
MIEFLNQEIQCEKGKKTLNTLGVSSGDESDKDKMAPVPVEMLRRTTIQKTTVNGIPMINEFPSDGISKKQNEEKEEPKEEVKPILSKTEAEEVAETSEFKNFFGRASRLMERGLFSDIDVIGSFERLEVEEGETTRTKDQKIIEKCHFMKDNPIKRAITNIEWSPKHKELFLCSYSSSENDWDPNETDGLVNIFSTQMPTIPELTLTCQSEITSCIFHPIDPFLVIGGTYSGNVIIWDMREKRNYPVVKTSTSASVMIKGISVVGSQNANNIVTVSNDGSI